MCWIMRIDRENTVRRATLGLRVESGEAVNLSIPS
jgi:hypothetical protein